ncbi:histidine ammonia-lyase [Chondrinema litorale]|uniref:histidine ammonia-lyase n=1 Tax=Chondrinema litorale TaxID=2994555 RepID=UPI002543EF7D|nr:histidine ammonia-lyase [Chondrinema litorale]UZR97689.1 histidine ammonia-lyase [Chondrinema litorale]
MFKYGIDRLSTSKALAILNRSLEAGLTPEVIEKIESSHNEVLQIAKSQKAVYGINTGFGPLCNTKIATEATEKLQRNLLISHSVGVGDMVSPDISKLMLILKIHSLSQGYSGISYEILERMLWHIDEEIIPVVPEQGSVGASGDLAPLSHLFLPLIGEGFVFVNGEILPTSKVLKERDKPALSLHPKAGLALINGTQFILAHAVVLVDRLFNCLSHADVIAGLMVEGLMASPMPFRKELHEVRPFSGNIHVASRIDAFLKDSEIVNSHKECDRVQDPYSLRCVPQVHGSSRNAWLHLKEAVEIELNSVTDNPIIFSKDFTISGGNFHGQPLALPIDYACLAAAELGSISDRRTYLSLDGKYNSTPKMLLKETGINSGFMICQYTSAALVSENKGLCFPASADSIPTSMGQEDHVSMGSIGGRKALRVCNNLEKILAVELLCAAQAFDFRKPLKSGKVLDAIHDFVRSKIAHADEDRLFGEDINTITEVIQSRKLLHIVSQNMSETAFSDFDELYEKY